MKILKWLLICVLAIVVVAVVISFFLSSKVHVQRELTINAPAEKVYAQINTLKNWESWSPWHKKDPKMVLTYFGEASGSGAGYAWKSDMSGVGNGKMIITKTTLNESVSTDMDFMENGKATADFKLEKDGEGTKVIWGMDCDMSKPPVMGKIMGLMMDKMVGGDFEKGLNNLKEVCEKK
ncbi:MAG: SRPBCC family protein [Bacteroidetes bacterium]|nr:SRPBCC family protein [Bacteroidota bacterium]